MRGALRPGRRAALAAGVGCAAYGVLKLYWALGGELLLRQAPLSADQRRELLEGTGGALTVENWVSVALAAIGIALAFAMVRDRRLPRLLVVGLPALIGAFMLARAVLGAAGQRRRPDRRRRRRDVHRGLGSRLVVAVLCRLGSGVVPGRPGRAAAHRRAPTPPHAPPAQSASWRAAVAAAEVHDVRHTAGDGDLAMELVAVMLAPALTHQRDRSAARARPGRVAMVHCPTSTDCCIRDGAVMLSTVARLLLATNATAIAPPARRLL